MSDLHLKLFGAPRLEYQGQPIVLNRRKALALAAYLALAEEHQSRDTLAGLLWAELDHKHAHGALRSSLSALTTAIPVEWIEANRSTIAMDKTQVQVDVSEFLTLLIQVRAHNHADNLLCDACVDWLRRAVALYADDFMLGYSLEDCAEYNDWVFMQQEWLRLEYAGALRRLCNHFAESQQIEEAIAYAHRWLAVDTLHEPAHRLLIRLHLASGHRSEALRQYKQCVSLLETELATVPEEQTLKLYEEIQAGQPFTNHTVLPTTPPSIGLLPPLPALMIGRDGAMRDILERLGTDGQEPQPLTVIQGWPGIGKSTLVARLAHHPMISQLFPDGVLWASLGETPNLLKELLLWSSVFTAREAPRLRKIEDISAQLTAILHNKRMLLIVDDIWKPEDVVPFRIGGPNCASVFTTRLNDVAMTLAPTAQAIFRLPVLAEEAGLELLTKLTPDTVAAHPAEARTLIRDLEGLPLAIQVAGRLLQTEARFGWGVIELLAELREGARILQSHAPSDMLVAGQETSPTVATLLRRSTDHLDSETRWRYAVLGLFVPKPATFDLKAMSAVWAVDDPRPTARILVNRGLLEPVSGGRFQLHALLVLHARAILQETTIP
ncbi:MAG: hypothetical protein KF716_07070 [Anaerolineae bacterium]|nr:hypothetical protein [Anaerolineae bacterium]